MSLAAKLGQGCAAKLAPADCIHHVGRRLGGNVYQTSPDLAIADLRRRRACSLLATRGDFGNEVARGSLKSPHRQSSGQGHCLELQRMDAGLRVGWRCILPNALQRTPPDPVPSCATPSHHIQPSHPPQLKPIQPAVLATCASFSVSSPSRRSTPRCSDALTAGPSCHTEEAGHLPRVGYDQGRKGTTHTREAARLLLHRNHDARH